MCFLAKVLFLQSRDACLCHLASLNAIYVSDPGACVYVCVFFYLVSVDIIIALENENRVSARCI